MLPSGGDWRWVSAVRIVPPGTDSQRVRVALGIGHLPLDVEDRARVLDGRSIQTRGQLYLPYGDSSPPRAELSACDEPAGITPALAGLHLHEICPIGGGDRERWEERRVW